MIVEPNTAPASCVQCGCIVIGVHRCAESNSSPTISVDASLSDLGAARRDGARQALESAGDAIDALYKTKAASKDYANLSYQEGYLDGLDAAEQLVRPASVDASLPVSGLATPEPPTEEQPVAWENLRVFKPSYERCHRWACSLQCTLPVGHSSVCVMDTAEPPRTPPKGWETE